MARTQKETTFEGKLYDQKDRSGTRQLVLDQAALAIVLANAGVQSASTVAQLVAALQAAIAALQ